MLTVIHWSITDHAAGVAGFQLQFHMKRICIKQWVLYSTFNLLFRLLNSLIHFCVCSSVITWWGWLTVIDPWALHRCGILKKTLSAGLEMHVWMWICLRWWPEAQQFPPLGETVGGLFRVKVGEWSWLQRWGLVRSELVLQLAHPLSSLCSSHNAGALI